MKKEISYFRQIAVLVILAATIRFTYSATQTINTLPSADATFIATLQTFLGNEIANYMHIRFGNEVAIGGLGTTDADLTNTVPAVVAFPNGFYVSQAATSHTYTATKRTFVFVRDSDSRTITFSDITAVVTYDDNLVFATAAASTTQPITPAGCLPLFYADTNGTSITAVTDLRFGEIPVEYYDDFEDAVDNVGANQTILITQNTWTGTKTATQRVEIKPGGRLLVEDGATLTTSGPLVVDWGSSTAPPLDGYDGGENIAINGGLIADPSQRIFGSNLTVTGTPKVEFVTPDMWGVNTTPGTTNMATAIAAAFTFAGQYDDGAGKRMTVKFLPGAGYASASALVCPSFVNLDMQSRLIYTGSSEEIALTVGETAVANKNGKYRIQVSRSTLSDWTNTANIGVKFFNPNSSDIRLEYIDKFTIGAQIMGEGAGAYYNVISVGKIRDNKYGIDLNSSTAGYVNSNTIIGGSIDVQSATNTTVARYGIRIISTSSYYNNNNIVYNTALELAGAAASGEAVGLLVDYGQYNKFHGLRSDGDDYAVRYSNNSEGNEAHFATSTSEQDDQSTSQGNIFSRGARVNRHGDRGSLVFTSGPLQKRANYSDGGTSTNIPGVFVGSSSNALVSSALNTIPFTPTYVQLSGSRTVGIFMDTSVKKRFLVRKDVDASYPGRIAIRAYDSNGTILTSADANHPYAIGLSSAAVTYTANYGGAYYTGSDDTKDFYFRVHDDVKKVAVLLTGGTAAMRTRGFSIFSLDGGYCATWTGYEEMIPVMNIGSAVPTAGTWRQGHILGKTSVAAGGAWGWVCTHSGTFGAATDNTGDTDGSTGVITGMTDTSDFAIGDFVDVSAGFAGTGPYEILAITATSITITQSSNSAQSNITVDTSDPVFNTTAVTVP